MDNELGINGGRRADRADSPYRGNGGRIGKSRPPGSVSRSDKVSLSVAYHAIHSTEVALRLQNLELHVDQRSYWVPSGAIGRDLVGEHLAAA